MTDDVNDAEEMRIQTVVSSGEGGEFHCSATRKYR
jgi:hypothetical protein